MLKDRLGKVTLFPNLFTFLLRGVLVLHVIGEDSPVELGLTRQFEWSLQVWLVKAWKNCVAKISLKSGFQVLLTTLFCGESGQAHSVSPVHVQEIQLGGVLLVEFEVC